jgi:hypothetical protein
MVFIRGEAKGRIIVSGTPEPPAAFPQGLPERAALVLVARHTNKKASLEGAFLFSHFRFAQHPFFIV